MKIETVTLVRNKLPIAYKSQQFLAEKYFVSQATLGDSSLDG